MSNSARQDAVVTFPAVQIAELYAEFEQALMDGDEGEVKATHDRLLDVERRLRERKLMRKQGG